MRLSSIRIVTGVSCLLFGAAAWRLGPHSSSDLAEAQTSQAPNAQALKTTAGSPATAAKLHSASATISTTAKSANLPEPKLVAAPGTEIYTAKRGEAIPTIAHRYIARTSYLTSTELSEAIRAANHRSENSNILKANEQIIIPGIISAPIVEKTIPVPKDFEVRAVYLTGYMAGSDKGLRVIRHWREVGGNSVVFDIKDSDGSVTIAYDHPLLGEHPVYLHDVPKFVHFLHQQNMHAIARMAIFRDERLVVQHPELAVQSRKNKTTWRENGKLVWTDPSNPKVQDYDIALAKHVAQLGVDEIQFDYVRFPAEGDQKDAAFVFQNGIDPEATKNDPCSDNRLGCPAAAKQGGTAETPEAKAATTSPTPEAGSAKPEAKTQTKSSRLKSHPDAGRRTPAVPRGPQRSDVITAFLKKAYAELHPTGVLLSLDVFGVMAWQRQVDLSHTGQDIVGMAHYCDVLSPMIYPSHFFGMDNIEHPGDEPAHFIGESMDRFELITQGSGVVIRPWLQAFHWRTKTYSPEYIKIQVKTARAKGGIGFLFWNAANDYSKPFVAMPEMKEADSNEAKDKPTYFRGDELHAPAVQASATTPATAP